MDFTIPSAELAAAFREGKGFDGSSVAGFVRIEESDLVIKPDPATFRVLPWEYRGFDDSVRWREAVIWPMVPASPSERQGETASTTQLY